MVSLIICTYNRADALKQCLQACAHFPIDEVQFEIIVVDNNSSDHTKKVVQEFLALPSFPLRYFYEARQGLSYARNRGISEARYPVLGFTDDDCLPEANWVARLYREFSSDATLSILGGQVVPGSNGELIGIRPFPDRANISSYEQIFQMLIGCNMSCRRQVFQEIGVFDDHLGKGAKAGSGEDLDFFYRAFKQNLKIAYSPDVKVVHQHCRTVPGAIQTVRNSYARGRGAFYGKHILAGDMFIGKRAYWEIIHNTKCLFSLNGGLSKGFSHARQLLHLLLGGVSSLSIFRRGRLHN